VKETNHLEIAEAFLPLGSDRFTLRAVKSFVPLLALALLLSACASHSHPHQKTQQRLRRAPGESAEDFADRKEAIREYQQEVREQRKENSENARSQAAEPLGGQ
jgi:hypothetical protein